MPEDALPPAAALAAVRALVLDVDGVLTDGRVMLDAAGRETKALFARDGTGLKYWIRAGRAVAVVSGGPVAAVAPLLAAWGVEVRIGDAKDKLPAFLDAAARLGVDPSACAYMGDDLPDLPPMRAAGVGIAVADAAAEVRAAAAWVTRARGGAGAAREAVEALLRAQGAWAGILARYAPRPADAP